MKPPLSHHLAIALAETAHQWTPLKWVSLGIGVSCAVLAIVLNVWWLWLIAVLSAAEGFVLYIGKGFYDILEVDQSEVADLRRKYAEGS